MIHVRLPLPALSLLALAACAGPPDRHAPPLLPQRPGPAASLEDPIQRGRYLVDKVAGCPACHTPHDESGAPLPGRYLAGWACFQRGLGGACQSSRNLTSHPTGLGNRSDQEIGAMIFDGLRPPSAAEPALHPAMPYWLLHNLHPADQSALVAYLRTVPPVEHAVPRSSSQFDVERAARPLDLLSVPGPLPRLPGPQQQRALRGRYLAAVASRCIECHTRPGPGDAQLDATAYFLGGRLVEGDSAASPTFSPNLTPDLVTGLGSWGTDEIVGGLLGGTGRPGRRMCPPPLGGPSGAYAGLRPEDAQDIALFLQSLAPRPAPPTPAPLAADQ